jgi:hypothetical protein
VISIELKDKILDVIGGVNISAFATVQSEQDPVPGVRYLATVGFQGRTIRNMLS